MPSFSIKYPHLTVQISDARQYVVGTFIIEDLPRDFSTKVALLGSFDLLWPDDEPGCVVVMLEDWEISSKFDELYAMLPSIYYSQCFSLMAKIPADSDVIVVDILLQPKIFPKLESPADCIYFKARRHVMKVFECLEDNPFLDESEETSPDFSYVQALYDMLRERKKISNIPKQDCQSPYLIPKLRQYQHDGVSWMINREKSESWHEELHPLYKEYTTVDGLIIYANQYGGYFSKEKFYANNCIKGGILADEMGLGKTIEMLSLILLHPREECSLQSVQVDPTAVISCSKSSDVSLPMSDTTVFADKDKLLSMKKIPSTTKELFTAMPNKSSHSFSEEVESPFFLCVCGKRNSKKTFTCKQCNVSQHIECTFFKCEAVSQSYICPFCIVEEEHVTSRATLIVSPATISSQWCEELENHILPGSLKVFKYKGVKQEKFVPPSVLADNDIVIVSYETLREELKYVDLQRNRNNKRRHDQKYTVLPSPLISIDWWRICLDEAQMVEGSCKAALMALKLHSVNRWCVTGTPIQKSALELHGLLVFLNSDPYAVKKWFIGTLYRPFTRGRFEFLVQALDHIFWRTLKQDVADQINLPAFHEVDHKLDFIPLERYFYGGQHEKCSLEFREKVENLHASTSLKSLDRRELSRIMTPLIQLRQACCHPQAVRGQFIPPSRSIMTMEEITESLIKKAELQCEEILRAFVADSNGLAGLWILEGNVHKALSIYASLFNDTYSKELIKVDSLQQIHTLYNFVQVSLLNGGVISQAVIDTQTQNFLAFPGPSLITLPDEFVSMRDIVVKLNNMCNVYCSKSIEPIVAAVTGLNKASKQVQEIRGDATECNNTLSSWFKYICDQITLQNLESPLLAKLKTDPICGFRAHDLINSFNTLHGVLCFCQIKFGKLLSLRDQLCNELHTLLQAPIKEEVSKASACHLRRKSNAIPEKCSHCKMEETFGEYEKLLFNVYDRKYVCEARREEIDYDSENTDVQTGGIIVRLFGNWADGLIEKLLKFILNYATHVKLSPEALKNCFQTIQLLDVLKSEFRLSRTLWRLTRDSLSAQDELDMAKLRFTIVDKQHRSDYPTGIEPHMVAPTIADLEIRRCESLRQFIKMMGRLSFLKQEAETLTNPDCEVEICPICRYSIERRWGILTCGHRLCTSCLAALIRRHKEYLRSAVSCPVCREQTKNSEILFLDAESRKLRERVKGSYSTKILSVIDCLFNILNEQEDSKIIIFSSFVEVLNIVGEAMKENGIKGVDLTDRKYFQLKLETFKRDNSHNVLLLPVKWGANGLNIVEASTVIFIEPLLNPGQAAQAISRVHRIGQQKNVTVHHFFIENTIEEKIISSCRGEACYESSELLSNTTIKELIDLFEG